MVDPVTDVVGFVVGEGVGGAVVVVVVGGVVVDGVVVGTVGTVHFINARTAINVTITYFVSFHAMTPQVLQR